MSILNSIFGILVMLLKELLPTLIEEWKKPREIRYVGEDNEVDAALDASIMEDAMAFAEEMEATDAEDQRTTDAGR